MSNFSSRFKHSSFHDLSSFWKRETSCGQASPSLPGAGRSLSERPFATFDWTYVVHELKTTSKSPGVRVFCCSLNRSMRWFWRALIIIFGGGDHKQQVSQTT